MIKVLRGWMQRYFSDEEAVVLAVLLFLAFAIVLTLGKMLAPVLQAVIWFSSADLAHQGPVEQSGWWLRMVVSRVATC